MPKRCPTRYQIKPRYSPGSPAQVDEETWLRAAKDEEHFYRHSLSGIYGDEEKARAQHLGLRGIAVSEVEKNNTLFRVDHLTGETEVIRLRRSRR